MRFLSRCAGTTFALRTQISPAAFPALWEWKTMLPMEHDPPLRAKATDLGYKLADTVNL